MAVVINDFESVPAEPKTTRGAGSEAAEGEGASQPPEHEMEKWMELRASRNERVRAY